MPNDTPLHPQTQAHRCPALLFPTARRVTAVARLAPQHGRGGSGQSALFVLRGFFAIFIACVKNSWKGFRSAIFNMWGLGKRWILIWETVMCE